MRRPVKYREIPGARASRSPTPQPAAAAALAAAASTAPSEAPRDPSFEHDIRPIFAPFASAMMWRFDLNDYEAVMANAQTISDRLKQAGNLMPPPPFPPLTAEQVKTFVNWMNNGCKP
jgi:hypothetical protein